MRVVVWVTRNIFLGQNSEDSEVMIIMCCDAFYSISVFTDSVGSCLSSPFPHRILAFFLFSLSLHFHLWLSFTEIFLWSKNVSHYPLSLSHLSLLHLVIWIHFYFMYWFFPSFRLLNSSWVLVLCLLKDFFLPVFLLLFWSKWKNLPPLHHILGP